MEKGPNAMLLEAVALVMRREFHDEPTFGHGSSAEDCEACEAFQDALLAAVLPALADEIAYEAHSHGATQRYIMFMEAAGFVRSLHPSFSLLPTA